MKITYLAHSGFLVELKQAVLLFDYYKGEIPDLEDSKPWYVFVSHRHEDHFNPEIFELAQKYSQVTYLLSYDIKLTERNRKRFHIADELLENIRVLRPDESCHLMENMKVETIKSTDEGVAFLVSGEGYSLYHAGDLNWWYWKEEKDGWNGTMTANFKKEVAKIEGRTFDAVFLPLDDRQEEWFYRGMDWYLRSCHVRYAFPMHYWNDDSVIERFEQLDCRKDYDTVICDTVHEKNWEIGK